MSDIDLDSLDALQAAATPLPWTIDNADDYVQILCNGNPQIVVADVFEKPDANAAFIVAACNNIGPLNDEAGKVAALEAGIRALAEGWKREASGIPDSRELERYRQSRCADMALALLNKGGE